MPAFEAPSPVGLEAGLYQQHALLQFRLEQQKQQNQMALAQQEFALRASGHGGGGYGGGGGGDIQQAIQFRDSLQLEKGRAADAMNVSQGQVFAAQTQSAHARQSAELQAQLSQTQLTQQENMRLVRMKNAIGEVSADTSLSAEEKNDMIMQLKTGINPLQERATKQKLLMDEQLKHQQAESFQWEAAKRREETRVTGLSAAERYSFIPDAKALADISDDIGKNADLPAMDPQSRDALVSKMAHQEAIRQGLGHHMFQEGYGKWIRLDEKPGGGKGAAADQAAQHPTGLSQEQYMKWLEHADKQAADEQKMTQKDANDVTTHVHPQDIGWKEKRIGQILERHGLPKNLQEYSAQAKPQAVKGYDSSKAPWAKKTAPVEAASTQTPSGQSSSASVSAVNKSANIESNRILNRSDLTPEVRRQAVEYIGIGRRLLSKYNGQIDKMSPEDRAEFDKARKYVDDNVPEVRTPLPQRQTAQDTGSFLDKKPSQVARELLQGVLDQTGKAQEGRRRPGEY